MIIGIVGMIGSGKSTFTQQLNFERFSGRAEICEADSIGHELLQQENIQKLLRNEFGKDIFSLSGEIDRNYLRKKVCAESGALSRIEAILHPPLKQLLFQKIETYRGTSNVLFVVAALPITLEMFEHCDEVFSLSVTKEEAWKRIQKRSPHMFQNEFDVFWKRQEGEYGYSKKDKYALPYYQGKYTKMIIYNKKNSTPFKKTI